MTIPDQSLASTNLLTEFEMMVQQMRDNLKSLETRAASRTRDLQIAAEVSRQIASILDLDELLPQVVELTKGNFGLYHAQIYLLSSNTLVLAAGAGESGRMMKEYGHSIPMSREHSIVARCARTRQGVISNNVTKEPNFLPNPLLPDTRSEMALPMVVGDSLIGVLDVQSDQLDNFTDEDVRVQTILASQIAVAVQNARAFAQVEQTQREMERIFNTSIDLIGSTDFHGYFTRLNSAWEATFGWTTEALMAVPFIDFVHPDDVESTNTETAKLAEGTANRRFESRFRCNDGSYRWVSWRATSDMEHGLIHFVARDVTEQKQMEEEREILFETANALNNAQTPEALLDAARQYATAKGSFNATLLYIESDEIGDPLWAQTVAQWQTNGKSTVLNLTRFYLPEFPLAQLWMSNPDNPTLIEDIETSPALGELERELFEAAGARSSVLIPLRLRNRWVGILSMTWSEPQRFTGMDSRIYKAIAQQTTPAADVLRGAQEARRRTLELETVAHVSTEASTNLDLDGLLQNVCDLTKANFNLYHTHVYLLNETGESLVLTAGAGDAGRLMRLGGHRIPLSREQSLVARAARTRQGVISNDVRKEPNFLPNPLLPDTHSEMALPMVVGDRLIGVLDVQSDQLDNFTGEDVRVQTILASQIAVAVQNARAFAHVEAQAEQERAVAERLREVDRLKSGFLANMSHELRTPLNSIIGYSEILRDGDDGELSPEALEDVEAIHESGKHLLAIINDVLDLAKIEAGQMSVELRPVELAKVVSEVLHSAQVFVKDKPVTMEMAQDEVTPVVLADPIRLKQIVMNLVSNAAKFTERGSITVTLGRENDQFAYVAVADTGIGIADDHLNVIFEQFQQVDNSSTRRAGGTGLGLTITRHLVQLHGGEISVESGLGAGSVFRVALPVYQEEAVRG